MVGPYRTLPIVVALFIGVVGPAGTASGHVYTHEVLPGESVRAIAKRYHITPKQLRRQNRRLRGRKVLRAGWKLKIKTSRPCRQRYKAKYRVRKGDSPARIAKKYKMKRWLLRRLNPRLKKQSRLRVGQTLWVVMEGPRPGAVGGMYRLTAGPGYSVVNRHRAWGTFLAITRLMEVFADHARRFPKASLLQVGDLSRKGGGFLRPHKSHRRGRDVDVRFPLSIKTERYVAAKPETLDVERTWDLIERFLKTDDVIYVFVDYRLQKVLYDHVKKQRRFSKDQLKQYFQFPRSKHSMQGIIRHEKGHATHMHIRFLKEKRGEPRS